MKKFFVIMLVLLCTIYLSASVSSKKNGKMVSNPYSKENLARNVTGRSYSNGLYLSENGNSFYEDDDSFITEDSLKKLLDIRKSKLNEDSSFNLLTKDTFKLKKVEAVDENDDFELTDKELKDQMVFDSLMENKRQLDSISTLEKNKGENILGKENKDLEKLFLIIITVMIVVWILGGKFSEKTE